MLCQGLSLIVAALIHFGVLMTGYEHRRAGTAETVIGVVLLGALISTWIRPQAARTIGLSAQGFALLGTLVGIFTIVTGVGPRTAPDIADHVILVALLVSGLVVSARARGERAAPGA
jgi:hypothetical protein